MQRISSRISLWEHGLQIFTVQCQETLLPDVLLILYVVETDLFRLIYFIYEEAFPEKSTWEIMFVKSP